MKVIVLVNFKCGIPLPFPTNLQNAARLAAELNAPIKSCHRMNQIFKFKDISEFSGCYWIKKFYIF